MLYIGMRACVGYTILVVAQLHSHSNPNNRQHRSNVHCRRLQPFLPQAVSRFTQPLYKSFEVFAFLHFDFFEIKSKSVNSIIQYLVCYQIPPSFASACIRAAKLIACSVRHHTDGICAADALHSCMVKEPPTPVV